jgi:hypothetical protein
MNVTLRLSNRPDRSATAHPITRYPNDAPVGQKKLEPNDRCPVFLPLVFLVISETRTIRRRRQLFTAQDRQHCNEENNYQNAAFHFA